MTRETPYKKSINRARWSHSRYLERKEKKESVLGSVTSTQTPGCYKNYQPRSYKFEKESSWPLGTIKGIQLGQVVSELPDLCLSVLFSLIRVVGKGKSITKD